MNCPLCEAVNEEYRLIYKDNSAFCIVTKCPLKEGHVMILPIRHVEDVSHLTSEEAQNLFKLIGKLKKTIEKKYQESAIVHINSGIHSTQKHIHIHILPSRGGLRQLVSYFEKVKEREEMSKENMEKIKQELLKDI